MREGRRSSLTTLNAAASCGSARSDVFSSSADEGMDMRYADNTHNQLRNSLARISSSSSNLHELRYSPPMSPCQQLLHHHRRTGGDTRFDALIRSKETLLKEKDSVIINLRLKNSALEHRLSEMSVGLYENDNLTSSHSSRLKRSDATGGDSSKANLKLLLGKTEAELREVRGEMERQRGKFEERVAKLVQHCEAKNKQVEESGRKQHQLADQLGKYRKRTECLERYLGELPTIEENDRLKSQSTQLAAERESLSHEMTVLGDKLEEAESVRSECEYRLHKSLQVERRQREEIDALKLQIVEQERLKLPLQATEREQFKELRAQVERLRKEKDDYRRMLASANASAKQHGEKHRSEVQKLEEKITDARDESENIRQEMKSKQHTADKVNKAMVSLSSQNQNLMEENLTLQDKVKNLEKKLCSRTEDVRLHNRLQNELNSTVHELKCVTQLLIQSTDGSDINVSHLLGTGEEPADASSTTTTTTGADGLQTPDSGTGDVGSETERSSSMERRLRDIKHARKEIDEIRSLISNHYAEKIGDNCVQQ